MKYTVFFLLAVLACVVVAQGRDCNFACPQFEDPICASNRAGDRRTFNTECDLDNHNCRRSRNQFTEIYRGEC